MAKQPSLDQIHELERSTLRAICGGSSTSWEALTAAIRDLSDYSWRGTEHKIVYGALARIQPSSGESIAEQLPAQATRMGFPDVDWGLYLRLNDAAQPDISGLIGALKAIDSKEPQSRE